MKVLKVIASLFLATLVMVSSTRFAVDIHFCMGEASDIAFLTDAENCEMQQRLPPCHRQLESTCCDDETIFTKLTILNLSRRKTSPPQASSFSPLNFRCRSVTSFLL